MNETGTFRDHIPELDGLRGIACLMVLLEHLGGFNVPLLGNDVTRHGGMGVEIFFVLGGFLITRVCLRDREDGKGLAYFWKRRAARIFPIYYITLFVIFLFYRDSMLWAAAGYVLNWYQVDGQHPDAPLRHMWSLCIEEQFYLVWPLFAFYARRSTLKILAIGGVFLGFAAELGTNLHLFALRGIDIQPHDTGNYYNSFVRMAPLLAGCAMSLTETAWRKNLRTVRVMAFGLMAVAILGPVFLSKNLDCKVLMAFRDSTDMLFRFCWSLAFFCLAVGGLSDVSAVFCAQSLRKLGAISYGAYLFHYPIYEAADLVLSGVLEPYLKIAISLFAASLSFRYIEQPIMRWARREKTESANIPEPVPATNKN